MSTDHDACSWSDGYLDFIPLSTAFSQNEVVLLYSFLPCYHGLHREFIVPLIGIQEGAVGISGVPFFLKQLFGAAGGAAGSRSSRSARAWY